MAIEYDLYLRSDKKTEAILTDLLETRELLVDKESKKNVLVVTNYDLNCIVYAQKNIICELRLNNFVYRFNTLITFRFHKIGFVEGINLLLEKLFRLVKAQNINLILVSNGEDVILINGPAGLELNSTCGCLIL